VVVKHAASGNVIVSVDTFGGGIAAEIYQVKYVDIAQTSDSLGRTGPYPDPLWPLENGASAALTAGQNTAFWFSISVPAGAASGDYLSQVHIGGIAIPVRLHVFNFAVPDQLHVASQMNFSYETILQKYSVAGTDGEYWYYVDRIKQFFIDHRLTPSGVLWPGGLTGGGTFADPFISYCPTHHFNDTDGIWGFVDLAQRYLSGSGLLQGQFSVPFNGGTGFSTFMVATMADNDSSIDQRPSPFCGINRSASDWLQNPTSPYNKTWFDYIKDMQDYLTSQGYLGQAYDYFANEPQDQADYDAVAWYSRYSHANAPNLKLMVSEEPKPEIYNQPGAHIDIWLPVLENYNPTISQARARDYGEDTWIYFLHGTRPPYFNPITLDHPGIEGKLTGWFLWKYRIRGIAYYSLDDWIRNPWTDPMTSEHNGDTFMLYPPSQTNDSIPYGSNHDRLVPSIRLEMLRDGLEDYEYLYLLAGGGQPGIGQANAADPQVDKIISGLTSYTRDGEFLYNLRRLIGLKLGGEIAIIPDIQPPAVHPRALGDPGNYYINFQDPAGEPKATPLVVNGKTYMKIGASDYSSKDGYGWYSPPSANWKTAWLASGPNVLQRSILYSDWGRPATWEFDLPNGEYNVTLSVGWQGRPYEHQKVDIEGVSFVNDEATTPSAPYLVRTKPVTISDHKLTLSMGIFNQYTMLNYLDVEAANPPVRNLRLNQANAADGTLSFTLAWTPPATATTAAVRYAESPITAATWDSAAHLAEALPGGQSSFSGSLPYTGGTVYFAMRVQNKQGEWSEVSNLAFWPSYDVSLPIIDH
jgi:hypothetical protein